MKRGRGKATNSDRRRPADRDRRPTEIETDEGPEEESVLAHLPELLLQPVVSFALAQLGLQLLPTAAAGLRPPRRRDRVLKSKTLPLSLSQA